eukprot:94163_1
MAVFSDNDDGNDNGELEATMAIDGNDNDNNGELEATMAIAMIMVNWQLLWLLEVIMKMMVIMVVNCQQQWQLLVIMMMVMVMVSWRPLWQL